MTYITLCKLYYTVNLSSVIKTTQYLDLTAIKTTQYLDPSANKTTQYLDLSAIKTTQYLDLSAIKTTQYLDPSANKTTQYLDLSANKTTNFQFKTAIFNVLYCLWGKTTFLRVPRIVLESNLFCIHINIYLQWSAIHNIILSSVASSVHVTWCVYYIVWYCTEKTTTPCYNDDVLIYH